jgi:hypothetical protein
MAHTSASRCVKIIFEHRLARSEISSSLQADKITAEYKDGFLEVTAPLSESALPKKIEIKSSAQPSGQSASQSSGQSSGQAKSAGVST